eukprot:4748677-Pyramimonas_sp.AAC.1
MVAFFKNKFCERLDLVMSPIRGPNNINLNATNWGVAKDAMENLMIAPHTPTSPPVVKLAWTDNNLPMLITDQFANQQKTIVLMQNFLAQPQHEHEHEDESRTYIDVPYKIALEMETKIRNNIS